jgi:hypothetical protein
MEAILHIFITQKFLMTFPYRRIYVKKSRGGFIWLRMGASGGLLWMHEWIP